MAKVISEGQNLLWEPRVKCTSCGTEFIATIDDVKQFFIVLDKIQRQYHEPPFIKVVCPKCGIYIKIDAPLHIYMQLLRKKPKPKSIISQIINVLGG